MELKRLSDYLGPDDVDDGDIVLIVDEPTLRTKEETGFNRDTYSVKVLTPREQEDAKEWTLNKTTFNACYDKFGKKSEDWLNKQIRVKKTQQNVMGSLKWVLYGEPLDTPGEPQKTLEPPSQPDKKVYTLLEAIQKTKDWPPEDQRSYLDYLRSENRLTE